MSYLHVSPVTVLAPVRRGFALLGQLEDYFEVQHDNRCLRTALQDLENHGHITWDRETGAVAAR